jgi:hypothetical protein
MEADAVEEVEVVIVNQTEHAPIVAQLERLE